MTFLECAVALCLYVTELFSNFFSNIASELTVMSAVSSQAQSIQYMCYMHIAVIDVFNLHISTMNIHT